MKKILTMFLSLLMVATLGVVNVSADEDWKYYSDSKFQLSDIWLWVQTNNSQLTYDGTDKKVFSIKCADQDASGANANTNGCKFQYAVSTSSSTDADVEWKDVSKARGGFAYAEATARNTYYLHLKKDNTRMVFKSSGNPVSVSITGEWTAPTTTTSSDGNYTVQTWQYNTSVIEVGSRNYTTIYSGQNQTLFTLKCADVNGCTIKYALSTSKETNADVEWQGSYDGIAIHYNETKNLTASEAGTYYLHLQKSPYDAEHLKGHNVLGLNGNPIGVTIEKKEVTVSNISADTREYDGTKDATSVLNFESATFTGLVVGDNLTISNVTGTFDNAGAGTKNRTITLDYSNYTFDGEDANNYKLAYSGNQKTISNVTIQRKTLTVASIFGNAEITYDGKDHKPEDSDVQSKVTGLVDGESASDIYTITYTKNSEAVESFINADETNDYKVTITINSDNYKFLDENYHGYLEEVVPLKIKCKSVADLTVTNPKDVTYNAKSQQQKPTIKYAEADATLVEGTDYTLTYPEDTTNVGEKTVTIKGIGNYKDETTATYKINAAESKIIAAATASIYYKNNGGRAILKSDGNYNDFDHLEIKTGQNSWETFDSSNYVVYSGSTVIELRQRYLQTLELGKTYTFRFVYNGNYSNKPETSLTIKNYVAPSSGSSSSSTTTTAKKVVNTAAK